ncbi:MAG: universal stress protein [Magnetovibrionaceae bacterium]
MFKHILLSVDLSDPASMTKALMAGVEMARNGNGKLHVLTVVPEFGFPLVGQYFPEDAEKQLIEGAKTALSDVCNAEIPDDIPVQHIVAQGSIYHRILEMAEKVGADLIVISAHRPELKDYLLGPNAARVVRHANCSVLVIRD